MLQFLADCIGLWDMIFHSVYAVDFFQFIIALLVLQVMLGIFLMGLGRSTRRAKL